MIFWHALVNIVVEVVKVEIDIDHRLASEKYSTGFTHDIRAGIGRGVVVVGFPLRGRGGGHGGEAGVRHRGMGAGNVDGVVEAILDSCFLDSRCSVAKMVKASTPTFVKISSRDTLAGGTRPPPVRKRVSGVRVVCGLQ